LSLKATGRFIARAATVRNRAEVAVAEEDPEAVAVAAAGGETGIAIGAAAKS
jgi:hypothetical protein